MHEARRRPMDHLDRARRLVIAATVTVSAVVAVGTGTPAEAAPPSNDPFSSASDLSAVPPQTVAGTNVDATIELPDEPVPSCQDDYGASVWYRFVPNETGPVTVSTDGSGFDTVLDVFRGRNLPELTSIGCNDDANSSVQSHLTFDATAGTEYRIRVSGSFAEFGDFLLHIRQLDCANTPVAYVDAGATGGNGGTTWIDAFPELQDALDFAAACAAAGDESNEIWVAEGTYSPDAAGVLTAFELSSGLRLLGGFDGTETDATATDPAGNPTALSGDYLGDDPGDYSMRGDNAWWVITAAVAPGTWQPVSIDGFTVTNGGRGNGSGAGLNAYGVPITVSRTRFTDNYSEFSTVDVQSNETTLTNVEISGNRSTAAAGTPGVIAYDSTVTISNSLLADNETDGNYAVLNAVNSDIRVRSSTLTGNTANGGSPVLAKLQATPSNTSSIVFSNSIVWGNSNSDFELGPRATVTAGHSNIAGWTGGGTGNVDVDPGFVSPTNGDYRLSDDSPLLNIGSMASGDIPGPDIFDFDGDDDTTETTPDLDRLPRVINDVIDLGAYENQTPSDADGDGVPDVDDNCPDDANFDQADVDGDGIGDVCDTANDNEVFVSLDPERFANSKNANTFDGLFADNGPVAAGSFWKIQIADRGGVPETAIAAIMNVTATGATANGNVRVYPCTVKVPTVSSVNFSPGTTEPNEVIAKLSDTGHICIYASATVDVLVDVVGFVDDGSPYTPIEPERYANSKNTKTFDGNYADTGPVAGGTFWKIKIADRGAIPDTATSVVANVTVTGPTANGNLRVYPCTTEVPGASALNYTPGLTRPNELVAKLSDDGYLCVWTKATAHVLVDAVGYIEDTAGYTPIDPTRYAHSSKTTTFDSQFAATGPIAGGTFWKIQIADRGTVPADTTTVVANVTVTNPTANGNLRVYPCTTEIPGASALNYTPGMTRPNELVAKLSPTGHLCIWTKATTDVIVDIVGHNGTT